MAPRAIPGRGGCPGRHLCPGLHPLRASDSGSGPQIAGPVEADRADQVRRADKTAIAGRAHPAGPGDGRHQGDRQGPRSALPDGRRAGRGPAAVPRRRADPGPQGEHHGALLALGAAQPDDRIVGLRDRGVVGGGHDRLDAGHCAVRKSGRGRAEFGDRRAWSPPRRRCGTQDGRDGTDRGSGRGLQSGVQRGQSLEGRAPARLA